MYKVGDTVEVVLTQDEMVDQNAYGGSFNKGDLGIVGYVSGDVLRLKNDPSRNGNGCMMKFCFVTPAAPELEEVEDWV